MVTSINNSNEEFKADIFPQSGIDEGICAICKEMPLQDSITQKASRAGLYTLAALCSIGARVFFYKIALQAGISIAGKNLGGYILGNSIAVLYSKSFFTLEMWAARGIINDFFEARTSAEAKVSKKQFGLGKKITITALVILASLFARYPFALPAAQYNPKYAYLAGGVTLFTSVFIPLRSIQLSLLKFAKIFSSHKQNIIEKMQFSTTTMLHQNYFQIRNSLKLINEKITQLELHTNGTDLFRSLISSSETVITQPPPKVLTYFGQAVGILLTGILEYALAKYTFSLTKEYVLSNDILGTAFALFTVVSTTYLYGKAITSIARRTTNAVYNAFAKQRVKEIDEQIYPIFSLILKIEETISNIFALGPWFVIWGNFFPKPASQHWFFEITLLSTLFATLQNSSIDSIKSLFLNLTKNNYAKKALTLQNKYNRIANMIEKSSEEEYLIWYHHLPVDIRHHIRKIAGVSEEEAPIQLFESSKVEQLVT